METAEHILKYKQNSTNHLLHFPQKRSNQKSGTYIHVETVYESMNEFSNKECAAFLQWLIDSGRVKLYFPQLGEALVDEFKKTKSKKP